MRWLVSLVRPGRQSGLTVLQSGLTVLDDDECGVADRQADGLDREATAGDELDALLRRLSSFADTAKRELARARGSRAWGPQGRLTAGPGIGAVNTRPPEEPATALHVRSPNGQQKCAGRFMLVEGERPNGSPLWKHKEEDMWLYSSTNGRWHIGEASEKAEGFKSGTSVVYCPEPHGGRWPEECAGWQRLDGEEWLKDGSIAVVDVAVLVAPDIVTSWRGGHDGEVYVSPVPCGDPSVLSDFSAPSGLPLGTVAYVDKRKTLAAGQGVQEVHVEVLRTDLPTPDDSPLDNDAALRPITATVPADRLMLVHPTGDMVSWVTRFPTEWNDEFGVHDWYPEDVVCPPSWQHKNRKKGRHQCCTWYNLRTIVRRMLRRVFEWKAAWVPLLAQLPGERVREGCAAAFVFSQELMAQKGWKGPRKREKQIYRVLNDKMRASFDATDPDEEGTPAVPQKGKARRRSSQKEKIQLQKELQLFAPLIAHVCDFIDAFSVACHSNCSPGTRHGIVFRGIGALVAQRYESGSLFVWGCFSSTSTKATATNSFTAGSGSTLFILSEEGAADISFASFYEGEAERVAPPSVWSVLFKLPETLLAILETRSDVVVAHQQVRRDAQLAPAAAVDIRLEACRNTEFVFKQFGERFVQPRVRGPSGEVGLFSHNDEFLASDRARVALIEGSGGTGKTCILIGIQHRLLKAFREHAPSVLAHALGKEVIVDQPTPVFVHLPWAPDLFRQGAEQPLLDGICKALSVDRGMLPELQRRRIVFLLDSLDEVPAGEGPGAILRERALLPHGGIRLDDWGRCHFVICCRREFLELHGISSSQLDDGPVLSCEVLPFSHDEQQQYLSNIARQEAALLATRLKKDTVAAGLHAMRTIAIDEPTAERMKAALALPDEKKDEREVELARCRRDAEQVIVKRTKETLDLLGNTDMLSKPFLLYLAVDGARELARRAAADPDGVQRSPRWALYNAWLEKTVVDRIGRTPELTRAMPEAADRVPRLLDLASRLAVLMFAAGRWQSGVARCVEWLGGGEIARAALGVMPLRVESVHRDACEVTWRHRTLQEALVARALLSPDTPAPVWLTLFSARSLRDSPEAVRFFAEGALVSDADTIRRVTEMLCCVSADAGTAGSNAVLLLTQALVQGEKEQAKQEAVLLAQPRGSAEFGALTRKVAQLTATVADLSGENATLSCENATLRRELQLARRSSAAQQPRQPPLPAPLPGTIVAESCELAT